MSLDFGNQIKLEIRGWDDMVSTLKNFPEKLAKGAVQSALEHGATLLAAAAKARVPIGTGAIYSYHEKKSGKTITVTPGLLRSKIKALRGKKNYKGFKPGVVVGAAVMVKDLKYIFSIEYGHIWRKRVKEGSGEKGEEYGHYDAKGFMRGAAASSEGLIEKIIGDALEKEVSALNGRYK